MIAGTVDSIVMVEGEMSEVSEDEMVEAIIVAGEAIKAQCEAQIALAKQVGTHGVNREYCHENHDEELKAKVFDTLYAPMYKAAQKGKSKSERKTSFKAITADF
jgi:polyribonucleotide nucleotidyltransferase